MRLVFLHGVALDGTVWQPQLQAFPDALAPDIPGYGSRQVEGEADLGELEDVVDGADVVGHSFGAAVAVDLAFRRPGAIRTLTLVNPLLLGRSSNVTAWSTCVERAKAGDLDGARATWLGCPLFDGARDQVRAAIAAYRGAHWIGVTRTVFYLSDRTPPPRARPASPRDYLDARPRQLSRHGARVPRDSSVQPPRGARCGSHVTRRVSRAVQCTVATIFERAPCVGVTRARARRDPDK